MHPDDPRADWEDAVAAELRERWAFDERTLSEMLTAAASGIESSESPLHETVKLDAFGKGKSTSARHAISCNLGKTFEAAAAFGMTAGSALTAAPWVGVLGLLLFIKRLREAITAELDPTSAMVVWTMWRTRQEAATSDVGVSLKATTAALNQERKARSLGALKEGDVWGALKELEKLGVVEETAKDRWEIAEVVRVIRAVGGGGPARS